MKGEKLFQILGLLDDELITEAEDEKLPQKTNNKIWIKWGAAVACVAIIICSGIWYLDNNDIFKPKAGLGNSGHEDSSTFMHYAGPILPLNVAGDTEDITADRNTLFDFSQYDKDNYLDVVNLQVTDHYTLYNNSTNDKTISVIYPFISSLNDSKNLAPTLSANGKNLQTKLLIGDYTGGFTGVYGADGPDSKTLNLADIESWEGYKALLSDGKYFEAAQSEKMFTDQTVTVYTFENVEYPEKYDAATLAMKFVLPKESKVLTYGMNGASINTQTRLHHYDYFIAHSQGERVIVLGEPPAKYTIDGYENGACKKKITGFSATVKKETMLLSEVIKECMAEFLNEYIRQDGISPLVTNDISYRAVISMLKYTSLGDEPKDRYELNRLDDIIGESFSTDRVMYLSAQITIPAGQCVELEGHFIKGANYDFCCTGRKENRGVNGYDMMTTLGSHLEFIGQTAKIQLPECYEIIRQNFGFDIPNNINEVDLDTTQERYYIEIRKKTPTD